MRIKIKTLKKLIKEYGGTNSEANCECTFTEAMETLMPLNRTIFVFKKSVGPWWAWKTPIYTFSISDDMIECILVE